MAELWDLDRLIGWALYGLKFAKEQGSIYPTEEKRQDSEDRFTALVKALRELQIRQALGKQGELKVTVVCQNDFPAAVFASVSDAVKYKEKRDSEEAGYFHCHTMEIK